MEKVTLAGFGVWLYAGWVGYQEFHFDRVDWRLGLISLLNSLLFFGYQMAIFFNTQRYTLLAKLAVFLVVALDLCLLIMTQVWILRSPHTLISALGVFAGVTNMCVYIFKLMFIVVAFLLFLVNLFLEWSDQREQNELHNVLESLYSMKEERTDFSIPRRDIRTFFRGNEQGLATLPILEAEKQIILRSYTRKAIDDDLEEECAICLSAFTHMCFVCQIACIHRFHPDCILQWFKEKPCCPMCRKPFRFTLFRTFFRRRKTIVRKYKA